MNTMAGASMSLIEHVLKPARLPWLHRKTRAELPAEPAVPPVPTLASVEYELSQLRISLRGVVDFAGGPAKGLSSTKAPAEAMAALASVGSGLKRSDIHRRKLTETVP
jgi:hypothetical protein